MSGETLKVGRRKKVETRAHGVITGKVNEITVVDLDCYKWTENNCIAAVHPWIKAFGADFIDKFNTYTVKTVNGGFHLYFKYEPELKNCVGDECKIDIRNDCGYVVGAGSYVNYEKAGSRHVGTYNVVKGGAVAEMPEELKLWLFQNVGAKVKAPEDDPITVGMTYDISARDCYEIAQAILAKDPKYFDNSNSWRDFTVFTAHLADSAGASVWDAFSKLSLAKYDEAKNRRILKKCKEIPNYAIKRVLRIAGMSDRLPYYQYKKWNEYQYSLDIAMLTGKGQIREPVARVIDREQLGDNFYDEFLRNTNLIVKSDMGTGKSHSFLKFINDNHHKYISITPRQLLAHDQYEKAHSMIDDVDFTPQLYDAGYKLLNEHSLVIQLDSLNNIRDWDFSEHILFLDEVSSTIDYLINANTPNMQKWRCVIVELFIRMINECACVIACDADVDYATHALFQRLGINYDYVVNKHKHSAGVVAFEFESLAEYYEYVAAQPAWIIPTDSKIQAKAISLKMEALGIEHITITSDWRGPLNLSAPRIIFSPKIIYGLDSCYKGGRGVYPCYIGKTINPMHYMQQCNRERNMTELGYIFINKKDTIYQEKTTKEWKLMRRGIVCNPQFENVACVSAYCQFINNYDLINVINYNRGSISDLYMELYAHYVYRADSLTSNKLYHFRRIYRERGLIDELRDYKKATNEVAKAKDVRDYDIGRFNPADLEPHHKEIKDFLEILDDKVVYYREYFINDAKLREHKNIVNLFDRDVEDLRKHTEEACEFKQNIIKSTGAQLLLIHDMITDLCGGTYKRDGGAITLNTPNAEKAPQYMQAIKNAYGLKLAATTFANTAECYKMLMLMSRRMFGAEFMWSQQIRVEGTRNKTREYRFDMDKIDFEKRLHMWRKPLPKPAGYDDV